MAVPVLTTAFSDVLDRILGRYTTDVPMPRIIVDHPLQNVTPAALQARAEQIAAGVLALLDG